MFVVEIGSVLPGGAKNEGPRVILRATNLGMEWRFTLAEARSLIEGLQAALQFIERGPLFQPWEVKDVE